MVQFACVNCGAMIVTDVAVGGAVVCQNCNTRQAVPKVAVPEQTRLLPHTPSERGAGRKAPFVEVPPGYPLVLASGWVMIVAGGLTAVLSFAELVHGVGRDGIPLIGGMVGGVCTMGLGQLFHSVRDMAREAWRIRKK